MGTICVLKTANARSGTMARNTGRTAARPISLLAFLAAENLRLQNAVDQLERDTTALREALRDKKARR